MKIIAYDLGSNMAYASNCYSRPDWEHRLFKGTRLVRAADTLKWMLNHRYHIGEAFLPDCVVFERPFARGMHATRSLWGLAGLIEAVWSPVAAIHDFTPSEIKKWSTGRGNADKGGMTFAAELTGCPTDNEHVSDAWNLLQFALATLNT